MGIQIRQASSGEFLKGTVSGQVPVWNQETDEWDVSTGIFTRTDPVYVEDYLPEADNDIRNAIVAALAANPTSHTFILPSGTWTFVGQVNENNGFRNGIEFVGQKTELLRDLAGAASGGQIFFLRNDTSSLTHADNITFRGIKFTLLNALTGFFGSAVYMENASNCRIYDCEAYCTLSASATEGKIRWGFALLGGPDAKNNIVDNCQTTISQIQLCGQGRSVDSVLCTNIISKSNNDFAVSAVSLGSAFSVQNVFVSNISLHDDAGGGSIFLGTDGAGTGIGTGIVSNITVSNVSLFGTKTPDLDFDFAAIVLIDLGITSENVAVSNVNTSLTSTDPQTRSILVQSQSDETASTGVSIVNCNLGDTTTNDPLEALFISGVNLTDVQVTNVHVKGLRGIRILNSDRVTLNNVTTTNGGLLFRADGRNVNTLTITGCAFQRTTGFSSSIELVSNASRTFTNVVIGDTVLTCGSGNGGLLLSTGAAAASNSIFLSNVINVGNNFNATTSTAVKRASGCSGIQILTTISITVPAVAAGAVGYVDTALSGTRLSDMTTGEGVVVNPTADLVAAGAGGGFINGRISAAGTLRCAFVGPLAGGASNFTVSRAVV